MDKALAGYGVRTPGQSFGTGRPANLVALLFYRNDFRLGECQWNYIAYNARGCGFESRRLQHQGAVAQWLEHAVSRLFVADAGLIEGQ